MLWLSFPCSNSGSMRCGRSGLNSIFISRIMLYGRLQKLVSRLAILGVVTPPEDLNKVKKSVSASNDDKTCHMTTTSGHAVLLILYSNPEVSTATTKVNTASTEICTASFSDATWNMALLSMRARKFYQRTGRKIIIDGSNTAGYDKSSFKAATYKRGLATLEDQIVKYKEHKVRFSEEISLLKRSVGSKEYKLGLLRTELEKVKQEKEGVDFKIAKFDKLQRLK
ncbi:hypothetical protein Tco_0425480 [Tanacetum coccineum]